MDDEGIEKLIRQDLLDFSGYAASKSPEILKPEIKGPVEGIIKLDANENPYGCSVRVNRALADYQGINIYPDSGQRELRKQLQEYTGVAAEHIVASAGSDQLIDLILRLFVNPGDEVINCVPTFAMFQFFTKLNWGTLVEVPRDEEYHIDIAAVKAAITNNTKLIFLATPNNPTGTITPREDVLEVIEIGLPVVIDEAYFEFSGETVAPFVGNYKNLMVLRTFSKWAGLAGLRIGYGMFPQKIVEYLIRIKEPYCVNVAALVAVRETLKDKDILMDRVKTVNDERERLYYRLKEIGWLKPYPSKANFILCSVLKFGAKELQRKLEERGILVRYFDQPLLRDSIRISIGKPQENDILIEILKELEEDSNG
ncbi:MAG: histidinol-phosphate transaminase [Dehalococcoidia bacterium]|nr:MAG: histidinol-phosphate transaminase [Dehalococcoidia bacterium]